MLYLGLAGLTIWSVRRLTSGRADGLPAPTLKVA
jgi:hypothetical protein